MKKKAKYNSNRKYRDADLNETLEKKPQVKSKKVKKTASSNKEVKKNIFLKVWDGIKKFTKTNK